MEHILSRERPLQIVKEKFLGGNIYFYKFPILGGPTPPQTPRFDALVYNFIFLIKGYDFSSKPILAATQYL